MKFTEALILGSISTSQSFHQHDGISRCALETSVEANGDDLNAPLGWTQAMITWPWLNTKIIMDCPCGPNCGSVPTFGHIYEFIYHLNDHHHWPRPRIAEWVKPLETQYDVPVVVPTPLTEAECVTR